MKPLFATTGGVAIYLGKAEEIVTTFPDKFFGTLVLDPPFTFDPVQMHAVIGRFHAKMEDEFDVVDLIHENLETHPEFGHPHVRRLCDVRERLRMTRGWILDPYMGVGTTLVAAKQLGRGAVGIEIEQEYCRMAITRL